MNLMVSKITVIHNHLSLNLIIIKIETRKSLSLFLSIGIGLSIIIMLYSFQLADSQREIGYGAALIFLLAGLGEGLLIYLQSSSLGRIKNSNKSDYEEQTLEINAYKSFLKASKSEDKRSDISDNKLQDENLSRADNHFKILVINEDLAIINERIKDALDKLSKSANVNLVFGSLSTLFAVLILAIQLFLNSNSKFSHTNVTDAMLYYLPRLSIVIFIEIFAFFFLKTYRENLNDIKYFHNEKTNIEQIILSLKVAVLVGDQGMLEIVVSQLAKTERNFILKKGESTVELEKERLSDKNYKSILDGLKSILASKHNNS